MNVGDNGYFTTRYLDQQRVVQPRYRRRYRQGDGALGRGDSIITANQNNKNINDTNSRAKTPNQLHENIPRNMNDVSNHIFDNLNESSSGNESSEEEYDPDYLEEGITPAQLNILNNNLFGHYRQKRGSRYPSRRRHEKPRRGFYGYYIDQKKRFESSPYKPKMYTHRTFRDMFDDQEEDTGKYNPIEFVFQEPAETKGLKRVVKAVKGKSNEEDFDYYENLATQPKPVIKKSRLEPKVDQIPEDAYEGKKKEKKEKNSWWKPKLKKKPNGVTQDQKPVEPIELEKPESKIPESEIPEPTEDKKVVLDDLVKEESNKQIVLKDKSKGSSNVSKLGPNNEKFSPLWNYILSWLVYDATRLEEVEAPAQDSRSWSFIKPKSQSKAVKGALSPSKRSGPKKENSKSKARSADTLRNIRKNYALMSNNWNKPLSTMFNEEDYVQYNRSNNGKIVPMSNADPSREFVVEVDDMTEDDMSLDQEFYYNPETRQLEPVPIKPRLHLFMNLEAPGAVMSNIGNLIKGVKFMKIIFAPIDVIGKTFPSLQTAVIVVELIIFIWLLYELSLLIDSLCMMVKAVCAPMIAFGRLMNRIM